MGSQNASDELCWLLRSLEPTADANTMGKRGETPLHVAARHGQVPAIESLLAKGALIDSLDDSGASPLMVAVGNNHVEAARLLLSRGARISYGFTPDSDGPVQIQRFEEIAAIFRDHTRDSPPWMNDLPSELADELKSEEHLEQMIADFKTYHFMETEEHAVSRCNSLEMLAMLVDEFGADLNHVDPCGCWPLKDFAEANDLKTVQWLIERGAMVDQTRTGETALFSAVAKDNFEIVRLLIEAGSNVNQKDVDMCVPLSCCRSIAMAELLLQAEADPTITDQCGYPPWHFINDKDVRRFIRDAANGKST